MKYVIAAILLLLFFTLFPGREPKMHPLMQDAAILAMGDSLTYGFGASPRQSYSSMLQKLSGRHVVNAGRNGNTSVEGLKRLPALLDDPSLKSDQIHPNAKGYRVMAEKIYEALKRYGWL
ncbi:hypothetical protein [Sulfurovum lithotrophicum]|uniref:hypothetical protein n=1 Tax=Sulfurovum lithotrophicum TaxID=206403 RepID=UPI0006977EFB|nr:hypothetical protein [Sulfurovum lithotrophicum]